MDRYHIMVTKGKIPAEPTKWKAVSQGKTQVLRNEDYVQ